MKIRVVIFLLIKILSIVFGAKVLKNKLFGEPVAICGIHEIKVMMETEFPFSGNVYAKGYFDKNACRVQGDGIGNTVNITIPITSDCGMRKKRMVAPRGISLETTVIIMFHKLFLTKSDKAFHILCQYQEMNTIYTQKLDVSQLPTTDISTASNDEQPMLPKCKYEVLEGGENGSPLTFAGIGQPVYHKWTCVPQTSKRNMHCLTVHSCVVDDGQGLKQFLLDEKGCPVDPLLLDEIDYKGDLEAGRDSYVFKFADKPTIFFSCQLRVEIKDPDSGMCKRTSENCNESGTKTEITNKNIIQKKKTKTKKKIEPDFPRPSTPAFEETTTAFLPTMDPTTVDAIDENDDSDSEIQVIQNTSDEAWTEKTMEMPTTEDLPITIALKKKPKKKYRRPPRRVKDDVLFPIPEFVGVQHDLGIRRKLIESVNMDVTAGSVEVVDMPEIAMNPNSQHPHHDFSPKNTIPRNIFRNSDQICMSRNLIAVILFICIFFVLICITVIIVLIWKSTTWIKKGKGSITTTPPTTPTSTISGSILTYQNHASTVA